MKSVDELKKGDILTNMNYKQIKLARRVLCLNQTDFATHLGWTSKRNIVNLERNNKEVMTQTALAIECLLRRNNKFDIFEMIQKMEPVLNFIIAEIQKVNEARENPISEDDTNEELVYIFRKAMIKYIDFDFDLIDDEDALTDLFGHDGLCSIRDAEAGFY